MDTTKETKATARVEQSGDELVLRVGGTWLLTESLPPLEKVMPRETEHRSLRVEPEQLEDWDSSLPIFLLRVRSWCRARQQSLNLDALPEALQRLFQLISESEEREGPHKVQPRQGSVLMSTIGDTLRHGGNSLRFVGECALGSLELSTGRGHFSWRDFWSEMVDAGPKALPTIGLLSFAIGVTFVFEVTNELRHFGAQIWVIGGVALAVLRQTGPLIAAVVLAGRTGAAFAARIGNMNLGGEIDALVMLGVSPVNYLVLPRVAALVLMMPLITLYSDLLGVLGAFITCLPMLNIPAMEFWTKLESVVQLKDLEVGIAKGAVFGLLIALAGTMCGLQSERSAAGVSRAVTSAVVIGIVAVVLADALAAPILRDLNL